MKLSIMMPVYNEAARVERAIDSVHAVGLDCEIICVDDGSTDGTAQILERLRADGRVHALILHDRNLGKGSAIRAAIQRASGEVVVIQDADLEYDPRDLRRLLEPIVAGKADAVIGSRFRGETVRVLYYWHSLGNHLLTLLSNIATNLNLTDMESGYKVMRADLAKSSIFTAARQVRIGVNRLKHRRGSPPVALASASQNLDHLDRARSSAELVQMEACVEKPTRWKNEIPCGS